MMSVVPLLFISALTFLEQDIDGPKNTASYNTFIHRADVDGDGRLDIVLAAEICLQRNGAFPREAHAPIPGIKERPHVDCLGGALYARFADRLAVYQWENGAAPPVCKTLCDQAITWPSPAPDDYTYNQQEDPKWEYVRFESFLADLDSDGVPEIVLPGQDGLHVYRRSESGYAEAARLDIFPKIEVSARYSMLLPLKWRGRRIEFPSRSTRCSYVIEGSRGVVITWESSEESSIRYRIKRYRIGPGPDFAAVPEAGGEEVSETMPGHGNPYDNNYYDAMSPRRLNDQAPMDYTRFVVRLSDTSAYPIPINEVYVSTNGGKTTQTFRTQHGWGSEPFIDFNEDGRVDIVTWTTDMFDSGLRETVNRFLSGKKVVEEAHVHFQNAQGVFPKIPDVIGRFTIKMDKPMCEGGYPRSGDISGDFNGDRLHDVVIEYKPRQLAVYLCEGTGFAAAPAGVAQITEREDYHSYDVQDFDGDGRADILVSSNRKENETWNVYRKVYLTREVSP